MAEGDMYETGMYEDRFDEVFSGLDEDTDDIENTTSNDDAYSKAFDYMDEGMFDIFMANDKIFFRDNKEAIDNAAMLSDDSEKENASQSLQKLANEWGKTKNYESGSLTSLKNELRRKIYGGKFAGKQS